MQLSDFSYANSVTSELLKYSHDVPVAIALFNKNNSQSTGIISYVPCCVLPPEEDRMAYWDSGKEITYGRYLLFTNPKCEIIPFWTGFSAPPNGNPTYYCIWFENKAPFTQYSGKLKKFGSDYYASNNEIWITIPAVSTVIDSPTLKDFWHSVLKELQ